MLEPCCESPFHSSNDREVRSYNYWAADGASFKTIWLCRQCETTYLGHGDDLRDCGTYRCPQCGGNRFGSESNVEGYERFCLGRLKNVPMRTEDAEYDPCPFRFPAEDDPKYGLGDFFDMRANLEEEEPSFEGFENDPVHDSIPVPA